MSHFAGWRELGLSRTAGACLGLSATLLAALAFVPSPSAAATITEFPVPSGGGPYGITSGPDHALWFAESESIGRITTSGAVTEYSIPSGGVAHGITNGPDGALWFTVLEGNIGRITTTGAVTEFPLPMGGTPVAITAGPDGNLWFTDTATNSVGRITPTGTISEFPIPTPKSFSYGVTAGPDGNLWFTESGSENGTGKIGRITPTGTITEFDVPTTGGYNHEPDAITRGPDGALWFTEDAYGIGRITTSGAIKEFVTGNGGRGVTTGPDGALWFTVEGIYRITTSGDVTSYALPTANSTPEGITTGPDGALWFTENSANNIGRFTPGASRTLPRPVVTTAAATAVGFSGGTLHGTVNPNGLATKYHFAYGLTSRLDNTTPVRDAGSGTSPRAVSADVSGLLPGTTYHYRVIADNSAGQSDGRNVSFHTEGSPPTLELAAQITPALKEQLKKLKEYMDYTDDFFLGMKLVFLVVAPELGPELVELSLPDAAYFAEEVAVTRLAADPPDRNFGVVARPAFIHEAAGPRKAGANATFRRLAYLEGRVVALERAYLHAAERGQGAARAHRRAAAVRQDRAKQKYAAELATALRSLAHEVTVARRLLTRVHLSTFTLTASALQSAQQKLASQGLPASLVRSLRHLGLSTADIKRLVTRLLAVPAPAAPVPLSPLGGLDPKAINTAARMFAADSARIKKLLRKAGVR